MKLFSAQFAVSSLIFLVSGCTEPPDEVESDLADLNGDGTADVSYEFEEEFYYEFIDRNFDEKVDVSNRYGLDDRVVSSRIDTNFDGYPETDIFYKDGSVAKVIVDPNNDGIYEILFLYTYGEIMSSEKYYRGNGADPAQIGRIEYSFGYPIGNEEFRAAEITNAEFSDLVSEK